MADLPEPLLSDAVISNDLSNSSDQPEREPVIKVTGNQSISKDQLEAMAYSSPSWINWEARGGGVKLLKMWSDHLRKTSSLLCLLLASRMQHLT